MSNFSQGQGQFRRTAELDSRQAARKGEVVAKKATMAKSAIAEKGHFWMETR